MRTAPLKSCIQGAFAGFFGMLLAVPTAWLHITPFVLLFLSTVGLQVAQAVPTLNINWAYNASGTYTGQGFIADPGNNTWNNMTALSSSSLVYADGTPATGVSVTGTGNWNIMGTPNTLQYGMLFSNGTMTFTLAGLVPNGQYELAVMAIRPDSVPSKADITVGGTTLTVGPWTANALDAQNWAYFASITADGSGGLTFTAKYNSGDFWGQGYVDAFQLKQIVASQSYAEWIGNQGDNDWDNAANWSGGLPADLGAASLGTLSSSGTVSLNTQSASLTNILFRNSVATTVAGSGTLTLGSSTLITVDTGNSHAISTGVTVAMGGSTTITANGGLTVAGTITGSGYGITKAGSGTLTLTGSDSFSGGTTISGGTLTIGGSGGLGGGSYAGTIALSTGTSTFNYNSSASQTLSGTISGSGALLQNGSGTLTLTGANSYSGGTTLSAGVLSFTSDALGSSGNITMNGGTLQWASGNTQDISSRLTLVNSMAATLDTQDNNVTLGMAFGGSTSGALVKLGSGTMLLTGVNTYTGATTISGGTMTIGGDGVLGSGFYTAAITNNSILSYSSSATQILQGAISGSGALIKTGNGTLILSGENSYAGETVVSGGTLKVQNWAGEPAPNNMVLWLDAANAASLAVNADGTGGSPTQGQTVKRWTSRSGINYGSNGSSGPVYQSNVQGGYPVLRFTGTQPLTFNTSITGNGSTLFIMMRSDSTGWMHPMGISGTGLLQSDAENPGYRCVVTDGGAMRMQPKTIMLNAWAVHEVQAQAGNWALWFNNSLASTSTSGTAIGSWASAGGDFTGDIGEVLIYNGSLSAGDQLATYNYLNNKWLLGMSATQVTALPTNTTLRITSPGVVDLSGSNTVHRLYLDGVIQATGVWGSQSSNATYKDSHFSGTGTLTVTDTIQGTIMCVR